LALKKSSGASAAWWRWRKASNSARLPATQRASSSAVCTVTSSAPACRQSSMLRTAEPISSPASQQSVMKPSMRARSAASCAASQPSGSSSSTSMSE